MRSHPGRLLLTAVLALIVLTACQQGRGSSGTGDSTGDLAGQPSASELEMPTTSGSSGAGSAPDSTAAGTLVRGTVSGRVLTAGGAPVAGVLVVPRSLSVPAQPVPEMAVMTDRAGAYRWSLVPGRYELRVSPAGGDAHPWAAAPAAQPVTVVAGRTATVDLRVG